MSTPDLLARLPSIAYRRQAVTTDDGVDLAVQSTGAGPAVLLANGIGVTAPGLNFLVEHLRPRHRVVTWDYRGAGASRTGGAPVALTMARHAADALQVLDALGEERAAVFGWSMGVPVGLEMIRRAPERIVAFGALLGAPGQPFRAAFPRPWADLVHLMVRFARRVPWPAGLVLRLGAAVQPLAWLVCSSTGFVGPLAAPAVFQEHVRATASGERKPYFRTMYELMYHDARDVLPAIRCPVLVVAGERDWVTPPRASEEMARCVPGARLVMLPGASHFGVIEHGAALWNAMDELLEEAGWTSSAPAAAAASR